MLTSIEKNNEAKKPLIDISLFNDKIPKKLLLAFFSFSSEYCIIPKEPLVKLISNFPEIEQILKIDKSKIIHYFYFSNEKIHNILYDEEKDIQINYDEKNDTSYYFYLSLLIMARLEIINYKYNFEYVRKVFNKVKSINESQKYKLVIMSKLLNVLITNYKGIIGDEDEDEDEGEDEDENKKNEDINELKKIEEENNKIFTDNIIIFEEINLHFEEIKTKNIDEIYIIIIKALIKLKKFEDYEYTYNIIEQLDLENIAITKLMLDELLKILKEDEDCINYYKITKIEDLFNEKKINFFYILLKYVLKSPIYIYQITLLFDLKKFVMKLLNSNKISDKIIKSDKSQYLIWIFMDSEYYFSKIPESDYNKLKEIYTYYKNYYFESKKEEIAILTNLLYNNFGKYKVYLNEYDIAQKMNERYTIIKYFFERSKKKKNKEKIRAEELLKSEADNWLKNEDLIKSQKFNDINQDFADILLEFINENKNKEIIHKFFGEEIIKNFIKQFTKYKKKDSNIVKSIMKEEKLSYIKLKLCFLNSIKKPLEDDIDPTYNLLSNYSDLKSILEMNHPQTTKFLYFNMEKVLEILYDSNNKVFFEFKESNRSLSFYFYLNILLSEKFDIPRFKFKQDYIRELQDLQTKNSKQSYARLIRAKIIIDLIDISNTSKLKFKAENKKNYDYNLGIISKEVYCLNKVGLFWKSDDIKERKVEEIYLEIIISLIKNKKFEEYEKIKEAMEQLDFENIGLTQTMYEEIVKLLYNNKISNEYRITNEKDLSIEKKINFYVIFFKYIFKDSYKVYHLELFRSTRNNIKKLIKTKEMEIFSKNKYINKIKYILKRFNLPYESMDAKPVKIINNTNNFDSDRSILGVFGFNSSNYIRHDSNNNSSYGNSQEFSYNNDSMPSSSSFGNPIIQENDKNKNKKKKEIIIDESKVEEVKEYFKNKDKNKSQDENESSQLNILRHVNKFLIETLKKENKKMLETFQENILNSNVAESLGFFNLKDNAKKVELLKEIILNNKFQKILNNKEDAEQTFNKIIDEVFYFSEPIIDFNGLEKKISENSIIQMNSNSITNFNEWINNYHLPSK